MVIELHIAFACRKDQIAQRIKRLEVRSEEPGELWKLKALLGSLLWVSYGSLKGILSELGEPSLAIWMRIRPSR